MTVPVVHQVGDVAVQAVLISRRMNKSCLSRWHRTDFLMLGSDAPPPPGVSTFQWEAMNHSQGTQSALGSLASCNFPPPSLPSSSSYSTKPDVLVCPFCGEASFEK